jgi:dihydroneopterin aldolase
VDEIRLEGLVFFGYHGANPEETSLGQRFQIDLSVWLDLTQAARSDDLADTVSYAALYKLAKAEAEGQPSMLIEHLAGRILDKVMQFDARINKARVAVTKLNPPLKGSTQGSAAVVLERRREP